MANERVGDIDQPVTTGDQAIAQVPVFPGRTGPAGIKFPYRMKAFFGKREIVGGKKSRACRVCIPMGIQIVSNQLGGGGVGVMRKLIDRPTAKRAIRT